jgi:4a-hydroxytetrahydrobiopterin dehydratase
MEWTERRCVPCEGGTAKLTPEKVKDLLETLEGWEAAGDRIRKSFKFSDFRGAMRFVNQMAELAEQEGHHPDFSVHYSKVEVTTWTHSIGGLSENDFILAAKIDALPR